VARMSTASVWPTSLATSLRCEAVAPRRTTQWPPIGSQRYHRYPNRILPEPVHEPGVARSILRCVGIPVIVGLAVSAGPVATIAIAAPTAEGMTITSAAITIADRPPALRRKAARRP